MENQGLPQPASPKADTIAKLLYVDVVRGLAILAVVAFHAAQCFEAHSFRLNKHFLALLNTGQFGVPLFFTASAYTLMMSYDRRPGQSNTYGNFLIRRYFRIAPMYCAGILFYGIWSLINNSAKGSFLEYVFNALLLHGLIPDWLPGRVPGGWSIGVEVVFYLILPFVCRYLQTWKGLSLAGALVVLVAGLWHLTLPYWVAYFGSTAAARGFLYAAFPNQAPVFVIGALAYYLRTRHSDSVAIMGRRPLWTFLGLCCCLLTAKVAGSATYFWSPVFFGLAFLLLILWLSENASKLKLTLLAQVGVLSFSIYVTHFAVDRTLGVWVAGQGIAVFGGSLPAQIIVWSLTSVSVLVPAFVASLFTYRYIEKPGMALGQRLAKKFASGLRPGGETAG